MGKKQRLTNMQIVSICLLALFIFGIFFTYMVSPGSNSETSRWFKVNFYPADEFATISILDADIQDIPVQEYKGSTSAAWMFCFVISLVAIIIGTLYFAKERKLL